MPCLQTLTSHSSILQVAISTVDHRVSRAVSEVGLTACAANIIKVDQASASTEMSTTEGHCICCKQIKLPMLTMA